MSFTNRNCPRTSYIAWINRRYKVLRTPNSAIGSMKCTKTTSIYYSICKQQKLNSFSTYLLQLHKKFKAFLDRKQAVQLNIISIFGSLRSPLSRLTHCNNFQHHLPHVPARVTWQGSGGQVGTYTL